MALWQLKEKGGTKDATIDYQGDSITILCTCGLNELVKNNQGQGVTVCPVCGRQWRLVDHA